MDLKERERLIECVKRILKRILHLTTWTSTTWIHHRNGCNIPDLLTTTMITRAKATAKIKISKDKIAQYTGDALTPMYKERLVCLELQNSTNKREVIKRLEKQLECQNNGKALVTPLKSKHKRSWLWTQRGLKLGEKLRFTQALSETLPTKVNKTRGREDTRAKICKRSQMNQVEDDGHILSTAYLIRI